MKLVGSTVHKGLTAAAALTGAAVGITTAVNVATSKFSVGSTTDFGAKFGTLISRMVGPELTAMLFANTRLKSVGTGWAPQGINPLGPLNNSTFGGAILLGANHVIHSFIGGKYGYSYASPFIKAIAGGLLIGGIVGGIFDPPGGQTATPGTAVTRGISSSAGLVSTNITTVGRW